MNEVDQIRRCIALIVVEDAEPTPEGYDEAYKNLMAIIYKTRPEWWLTEVDHLLREMHGGIIPITVGLQRISMVVAKHDYEWQFAELSKLLNTMLTQETNKYDVKAAARLMRVSEEHLRRMVREGKLPATKEKNKVYFTWSVIQQYRKE